MRPWFTTRVACARYGWCYFPRRNGIEEAAGSIPFSSTKRKSVSRLRFWVPPTAPVGPEKIGRLVHIWFISHLTPGPGCLFAGMTKPREVPRQQQWCQFRVETHGPSKLWGDDGADAPDEGVAKVVGAIGSAGQRELAGKKLAQVTVIVRAARGPWGTEPAEKLELDCDRDSGVTTHQRDQIRDALGSGARANNVDIAVSFSES